MIPILVLTSVFIGMTAYFSSKNGITGIAKEFLGYKLNEVYKYAVRQNDIIKDMQVQDAAMITNAKITVVQNAQTVINSTTGGFLIVGTNGFVQYSTVSNFNQKLELKYLVQNISNKSSGWIEYDIGSVSRVGVFIIFSDWGEYFIIMEEKNTFYSAVTEIVNYLVIILVISLIISSILLLYFISKITFPIKDFVKTIQDITSRMDLTNRVKIYYQDEIGYLGFYFNNMIAELEAAYNQIKNYAYQTVLAKKKEERIRFIFQKFVPQEVINQVLNLSSDAMLIGNKQKVTVLFSDIRSFTTISESLSPEDLVLSLNSYFNKMVTVIVNNNGTIDKFIGDAIMAIFGAPLVRENDAEMSVYAALLMKGALAEFNEEQKARGKTTFNIGVGLNTGDAIVGNIGSEQKIDYTVIGDTVNLASRLEGLTKKYHAFIVISEFTKNDIPAGKYYYRQLDNVRVKGKNEPVKIYQPFFLAEVKDEMEYFKEFDRALALYTKGDFSEALKRFEGFTKSKPDDYLAYIYKERCEYLLMNPPDHWDGVETWTEK